MRCLVTGAAGFIGSRLSETLLQNGHSVRAVDAFIDYYPRLIKEANLANLKRNSSFSFAEANLANCPLDPLLDEIDWVFHLAAQAGVRASWGTTFQVYTDCNITATQRLLEASKNLPIKKFVYASSSSVYGDIRKHSSAPSRLGKLLVDESLITKEQLASSLKEQHSKGEQLGTNLMKLGFTREQELTEFISRQYGVPSINLSEFEIDPAVVNLVPVKVAIKHTLVAVNKAGGTLIVAMADPSNIFAIDELKFITNFNIEVVIASEKDIWDSIVQYYCLPKAQVEEKQAKEKSNVVYPQNFHKMHENDRLNPHSPYGVTKLAAENLCGLYNANFGSPTVSLRFFTVFGPRQRPDMAIHRLLRSCLDASQFHLYGDGSQTRDFTYVDDIVSGTMLAAEKGEPGGVFNLGGGNRISMNELIALVTDIAGKKPNAVRKESQAGDVRHTWADTTLARSELGWQPSFSLRDGLALELKWLDEALRAGLLPKQG